MADYCEIKQLPEDKLIEAARAAIEENPANAPPAMMALAALEDEPTKLRLAVLTSKYWGAKGVDLTVGFTEPCPTDLRNRILAHANAWSEKANIRFRWVATDPQVRITREDSGYWSYLGVDVLSIPKNEPTMCLEGFTMATPEREYLRVVRHEVGHTCGYPHEHMRQQIISRLNRAKTIAWGRTALGWSESQVISQILTPLSESSIRGTPNADDDSIMCYQLPGSITNDGQPIPGGDDITPEDHNFAAVLYPKSVNPPPPPPPIDPACENLCQAIKTLVTVRNRVRRGENGGEIAKALLEGLAFMDGKLTDMENAVEPIQLTKQDLDAITEAARAGWAIDWNKIGDLVTRLAARLAPLCPTAQQQAALPCAGLLQLLCPQAQALFAPRGLFDACAGLTGLCGSLPQLIALSQQLGQIIEAIRAACPQTLSAPE